MAVACGDHPADPADNASGQAPTTATTAPTSTTLAGRTYGAELTTTDGYRYKVTVVVGARSPTGAADGCPGTAMPGKAYVPVTLTVANDATDRPAPFPPLRIELAAAPGSKPAQVMVRDGSGACTFAPRQSSIGPGASAVFRGTSPAVEEAAGAGSAGQIEVKVSESTFSLAAPVP